MVKTKYAEFTEKEWESRVREGIRMAMEEIGGLLKYADYLSCDCYLSLCDAEKHLQYARESLRCHKSMHC